MARMIKKSRNRARDIKIGRREKNKQKIDKRIKISILRCKNLKTKQNWTKLLPEREQNHSEHVGPKEQLSSNRFWGKLTRKLQSRE